MNRLGQIHDELKAIEQTISQWCMRMAWPGGTPTPPFAAWESRSALYAELRALGVERPRYFHKQPRPE